MRLYEPIWEQLKNLPLKDAKEKGLSITANRRLHPRIIKAVIKEKWKDVGYKLKMEPHKVRLVPISKGAVLTFYLILSETSVLRSISSGDL